MKLKIDSCYASLNKYGEEICGNIIETVKDETGMTVLFSDGEGDGTGASVTSSFITGMATFLLKSGEPVDSVIRTIANTYTSVKEGDGIIPGISAVKITTEGDVLFAAMNMPPPIVLRRGKPVQINLNTSVQGKKQLMFSDFCVKKGTLLVFFNDGFLLAGGEKTDWNDSIVKAYLQSAYTPVNFTAKKITQLLITAADSLEHKKPKHDISVLTLQSTVKDDIA